MNFNFLILVTILSVVLVKADVDQEVVTFNLHNSTKQQFYLTESKSYIFKSDEDSQGKISLFIESMKCSPLVDEDEEFRGLIIRSSSGEWKICNTFDYSQNSNGLDTYYKFSGDEEFEIILNGNYTNDESNKIYAKLRVSIYIESSECSKCPSSTFCCGSSKYCELSGGDVRCIPRTLLCDSYLDCGRRCDADESTKQCIVLYYFMEWNLMYTLTTILIFVIIIPALIITGIKLHRNSGISRRNHIIRQQGRTRGRVSVVAMDLPPPNYADVHRNAMDASPPCFCQAVKQSCTCKK